jgi:hypothetical protein
VRHYPYTDPNTYAYTDSNPYTDTDTDPNSDSNAYAKLHVASRELFGSV